MRTPSLPAELLDRLGVAINHLSLFGEFDSAARRRCPACGQGSVRGQNSNVIYPGPAQWLLRGTARTVPSECPGAAVDAYTVIRYPRRWIAFRAFARSIAADQAAPIQHSIPRRQQHHRVLVVMVATEIKVLRVSHGHAHTRGCAALIAGVHQRQIRDGRLRGRARRPVSAHSRP